MNCYSIYLTTCIRLVMLKENFLSKNIVTKKEWPILYLTICSPRDKCSKISWLKQNVTWKVSNQQKTTKAQEENLSLENRSHWARKLLCYIALHCIGSMSNQCNQFLINAIIDQSMDQCYHWLIKANYC